MCVQVAKTTNRFEISWLLEKILLKQVRWCLTFVGLYIFTIFFFNSWNKNNSNKFLLKSLEPQWHFKYSKYLSTNHFWNTSSNMLVNFFSASYLWWLQPTLSLFKPENDITSIAACEISLTFTKQPLNITFNTEVNGLLTFV